MVFFGFRAVLNHEILPRSLTQCVHNMDEKILESNGMLMVMWPPVLHG